MIAIRILVVSSVAALATACGNPDATSTAPASPGMAQTDMGPTGSMWAMDPRMKAMHDMHQKMMSATTPAERQALMADHMKTMQDGMAMMNDMHSKYGASAMAGMGPMGSASGASATAGMGNGKVTPDDHRMMADHMATMQMMMNMMADRMPPASANK
jgi:hypothetical protein